ncbi:MAG: helix-turn-helix transcriptional regulator [Clostridiaceae bacterium]|nr:helix-turn-helix transcriptional regulator [Clostridiaceae bacterium]
MFGDRLKLLRSEKDLKQEELAKIFNVHKTTVSNWEKSKRFPDEDTLNKIADYFEVTLDYLLDRTNEKSFTVIKHGDFEFEINKKNQDEEKNNQIKLKLREMLDLFSDEK